MKLLLLFILLASLSTFAQSWKDHNVIKSCDIYTLGGEKIKSFPGMICQFSDDGSFLSASVNELKLILKDNSVKWSLPGEYHHQLNLSHDKQRILALSSKPVTDGKGKMLGIDHLLVLDKEGKILHETLTDWMYKTLKDTPPWSLTELTHFNSFHEIPKLQKVKNLPAYIKEGNFILNAYTMGIFILSSDLKTLLHHERFKTAYNHRVHDVQVLPNGNYLYFNNIDSRSTEDARFSSAIEMDHKGRIVNQFPKNPSPLFFSFHEGGIQELDQNHLLISHATVGSFIYHLKEKKIISHIYKTHYESHRHLSAQQVNIRDLRAFLAHWK